MRVITIGRSTGNNVVINDTLVSKSHCQIIQDSNGNYRLIDNNSTNGTYINGERRHGEVRLNQSDIIRIGNTTLPWQAYFKGGTEIGGNAVIYDSGGHNTPIPSRIKPDNFLVWSILSTIFCCLPFGIASIVNAAKVDSRWYAGDYEGSERAARQARTWFWWAFAVGIVVSVTYFVIYFIAGMAIGLGGLL